MTTEYVSNRERVTDGLSSVWSARLIRLDLDWHQDTERGQM